MGGILFKVREKSKVINKTIYLDVGLDREGRKEYSVAMKHIYTTPTKDAAKANLEDFTTKSESRYLYVIQSWRNNWDELTVFFDFQIEICKIIYTTNLIENLNTK